MTDRNRSEDSAIARRRKEQILEAAARCFREKGFHRSSMAQISAEAGMSAGHIYHYFKKKEDIVAAIVARERSAIDTLIEETRSTDASAPSGALGIEHAVKAIRLSQDPARASLMMEILAEAARNPEIAAELQRSDTELQATLLKLRGDDSPRARSRQELIAALMEGLSVRALRNRTLAENIDPDMLNDVFGYITNA
nr:TetR/AcrR family transcriptional regulator [Corticimicrobacter populi]